VGAHCLRDLELVQMIDDCKSGLALQDAFGNPKGWRGGPRALWRQAYNFRSDHSGSGHLPVLRLPSPTLPDQDRHAGQGNIGTELYQAENVADPDAEEVAARWPPGASQRVLGGVGAPLYDGPV